MAEFIAANLINGPDNPGGFDPEQALILFMLVCIIIYMVYASWRDGKK